jgi:hypothetical protein
MTHRSGKKSFPAHTWIGLSVLIVGQLLFYSGVRFVVVWLTPLMWTGYILFVDGLVHRLRGRSWLTERKAEFPFLALFSVLIWLVFEAYNFQLKNWYYAGVPETPWARNLAYLWSFATILPGVFETIDLISSIVKHPSSRPSSSQQQFPAGPSAIWFVAGLAMVCIPPLLPGNVAAYLFAPVWIGFIFLFDPINQRLGLPSVRRAIQSGHWWYVLIVFTAGLICGFIWETWNYQAYLVGGGHWIYTVPEGLRLFGLHYGQMPVLGLLGFPPFALELVLIYSALREIMGFDRWMPDRSQGEHPLLPRKLIEN